MHKTREMGGSKRVRHVYKGGGGRYIHGFISFIMYKFYPSEGEVKENKVFCLNIIFLNYWLGCSHIRCTNCCQ